MRIAIDAMGGDFGPGEIVRAAVQADRDEGVRIILVGDEATLRKEIDGAGGAHGNVEIVPASQVIDMSEQPTVAVRAKRDSSIVVGIRLVKDSDADAFLSPGNSGAVMAAALFGLGRITGVERPALAVRFPTVSGSALVLDVGANIECTAQHLTQFGQMGAAYEERVFGIARPRVALLSNGEEASKGTPCVVEAHALLRASGLNFIGNVEGKDIPTGQANVIVTDGFTGNVVLKLAEGMGSFLKGMIRDEARRDPISTLGGLLMKPAFKRVARRVDYEEYGGAPLLGVGGVCIIAHGRSNARAIRSAIRVARQSVQSGLVEKIRQGIAGGVLGNDR